MASLDGDGHAKHAAVHAQRPLCRTINGEYAAFRDNDGVTVKRLVSGVAWRLSLPASTSIAQPILSFSRTTPCDLAVSQGYQILIYDVNTKKLQHTFAGNGRTIIGLEWCQRHANTLAVATVDGSISVFALRDLSSPLCRIPRDRSMTRKIECIALNDELLAVSYGATVLVWALQCPRHPVRTISAGQGRVLGLSWHSSIQGRLLTASTDDVIRAWDLQESSLTLHAVDDASHSGDDDALFGEPDGLHKPLFPIAQIWLTESVETADWVGEHGTLIVLKQSADVLFYSYGPDWELLYEVYRLKLARSPERITIRDAAGFTTLVAVCGKRIEMHLIPSLVIDSIGGHAHFGPGADASELHQAAARNSPRNDIALRHIPPTARSLMNATSIARVRNDAGAAEDGVQPSRQLRRRRYISEEQITQPTTPSPPEPSAYSTYSTSPAMTSSLELPTARDEGNVSPMPFLSPSIPAREPSTNIKDIMSLVPLQAGSFESVPSTVAPDSDSDDETFTGGMQSGGTVMPGGVNVPLPKFCGALFAPNGQLLAFFPPKPQPSSKRDCEIEAANSPAANSDTDRVSHLFPTFGNLASNHNEDSGDDSDVDTGRFGALGDIPGLSLTASSFQSQNSWGAKPSPTKHTHSSAVDHVKVVVSVCDVHHILQPTRSVAEAYRIRQENGESNSNVSRYNASVADKADLQDTADVWRLLAMLLEDKVPLEGLGEATEESNPAMSIPKLLSHERNCPTSLGKESGQDASLQEKLSWAEYPFGAAWVVETILDSAERNADVQLLAYASAVVAEAQQKATSDDVAVQRLLTQVSHGPCHVPAVSTDMPPSPLLGVFQNDSSPANTVYQSPAKLRQFSRPPSATTSQLSTPYLQSAASTPPLSFSSFSRQITKLPASTSNSGSASPEHHRSSFSAAAKYYAQSITDKFANYGTSPPIKKAGTSPGMNDLSSSLPTQSGSWGKSVSFATSTDTSRESQLSKSYTDGEDGYDSDKTIDETSLPHTPRSRNAGIPVKLKNHDYFSDDVYGCAPVNLLPPHLTAKTIRWRQMYAEQLRCWGLIVTATELEKTLGLSKTAETTPATHDIALHSARHGRKAQCSICECILTGLEQLCPACLHTTHPACLKEYLAIMGDDAFECPAGCGCACAALPYDFPDVRWAEEQEPKQEPKPDRGGAAQQAIRRKAIFTDPRVWRARVTGESW